MLNFSSDNPTANTYCITGFSVNEDGFTWTDGEYAKMRFDIMESSQDLTLQFDAFAFLQDQEMLIYADDYYIGKIIVDNNDTYSISIPKGFADDGSLILKFEFPNAETPKKALGTSDFRLLAIGFEKLVLF